jgi:hypothetical protein
MKGDCEVLISAVRRRQWVIPGAMVLMVALAGTAVVQAVGIDPSGRYYRDGSGKPVFLIGYYAWAAVPDGYYIDSPASYSVMINQGSPYQINYIRISLGVNRMTSSTNPPSNNGLPTPVPFLYNANNKAVLADSTSLPNNVQWDPVFWNGLKAQCQLAKDKGMIVHVSIFDGVELRDQGGASYGYNNSFWNPNNQDKAYYPSGSYGDCGGCFYRLSDFNNNTGIGYYQRKLIDKTCTELASYDNVFFEVGNELLSSDSAWNTAVINYIRSKTSYPVSQCGGGNASNLMGYSQHSANTLAELKANLVSITGHGYPAWEDPDGPGLCYASPDDLRRAAWYSFVGGAPCWGGFTTDFWTWPIDPPPGFNAATGTYYRNLELFLQTTGVPFTTMLPMTNLVSNGGTTNGCLADAGTWTEYLAYVLNDATATVDLSAMAGTASYWLYDPKAGSYSTPQTVAGGAVRSFNKPAGADDWVIYISKGGSSPTCPGQGSTSILGVQQILGSGINPCVATDSQGNIHVVYLANGAIQYSKYDAATVNAGNSDTPAPLVSETIATPNGAYWLSIQCDSGNVPHIAFSEGVADITMPYTNFTYYTNRIGGSWKTPLQVNHDTGKYNNDDIGTTYPSLSLWGNYAYVGTWYTVNAGKIVRLTNLSTTPAIDTSIRSGAGYVLTGERSANAVNGAGHVFSVGRQNGSGGFVEEFDSSLNAVCSIQKAMYAYPGAPHRAWAGSDNNVHFISWESYRNTGGYPCNDLSEMCYTNTNRRSGCSFPTEIHGLRGGPAGSGPDGSEVSGWWNDDVSPVVVVDRSNQVYVAWREWTPAGAGMITTVTDSGFVENCTADASCGGNICTGMQFTPSLPRRRWRNCEMAPTSSGGVYVVWDNGVTAYLRPVGVTSTSQASIDMGPVDVASGLTNLMNGDGNTVPATNVGGRDCRRNADPIGTNGYFYFGVSDFFALNGSKPDLYVYLDYFDMGFSTISLNYDSSTGTGIPAYYRDGGSVTLTNTNTWKSAVFHVADAYFGNRENAGADFRFGDYNNLFYLDKVLVTQQGPLPPVIGPIPSDESTYPGAVYSLQLSLVQGFPPPTWTVLSPAGAQIDACGLVTWTVPGTVGDVTFTVQAASAAGSDVKTWAVRVISTRDFDLDGDVDQSDFGFLQQCLSGSGLGYGPSCAPADLDGSGAIDQLDFSLFWPCLSGPGEPPGC